MSSGPTTTITPVGAASARRGALALGMVGALGEEMLAALVGSTRYHTVHVAVTQPIATATARFAPWVIGNGVVLADDAYVCLVGPETFVPKATPMQRFAPHEVLQAASVARDCGVQRIIVVSPLPALLQLNAAAHTLSSSDEMELAEMGFSTLLVVRPTAQTDAAVAGWLAGAVRAVSRMVLEIMLPHQVQPLRARTVALAVLEAARRVPPGLHVLGARELVAIVAETMPDAVPRRARLR
jgi:hypothetical protein